MTRIALGLAAVLLSTAAAQAGDPFAVAYGNTVTQTLPNGSKTIIYVSKVLKGTYAWKDDTHACFTETDPAPADPSKATNCSEIKGDHKVGDSWTETMADGKTQITMSITAGR